MNKICVQNNINFCFLTSVQYNKQWGIPDFVL